MHNILPEAKKINTKTIMFETRIIKSILKNERVCRDIKTEKAQEQDWDGTSIYTV